MGNGNAALVIWSWCKTSICNVAFQDACNMAFGGSRVSTDGCANDKGNGARIQSSLSACTGVKCSSESVAAVWQPLRQREVGA